ncbi:MAG: carboxypeptidase regulatory-like domain-containing protein [Mucilaginibacter sp.]|nr:carboxypeptidase regulatory-like domain-containing protein [Mucilaginibacter sp.]
MTVKSYQLKTGLIALILFLGQFALINASGQTNRTTKTGPTPKTTTPPSTITTPATYMVKGAMSNGALLKFTHLAVLDAHGKVVSRWVTDSIGLFKITGLTKGRYRLVNSAVGIDTPFSVPGQSDNALIVNIPVCNFGAAKAQKDIKAGKPMLLLSGGIAPISSPKEDRFEKKYLVKYHDFGDTPPDIKCMTAYNNIIFAYLDKKFGKSWRKDARDDVISLKR